ncbi:MAG: glutathione S-transferase family protein [bacterium]|nr:glutathione S-transferase family protein [bacterium]
MANINVYGMPMGTSFRVHWALHEMGLTYETVSVQFAKGEHKAPSFLAMNPMGQVPVIDVDGFVLPESVAITQYLALKFAPAMLGATPEAQAQALRWALWCMINLNPALSTLASVRWTGKELSPEVKEEKMAVLARLLPILDAQLAGKEYLLGEFGIADVNVRPTLQYAEMAGVDCVAYPNVAAWMARCAARQAYVAAKGPVA